MNGSPLTPPKCPPRILEESHAKLVEEAIGALYALSEAIALIDMFACFAENCFANEEAYCRHACPTFAESTVIVDGMNPVIAQRGPGRDQSCRPTPLSFALGGRGGGGGGGGANFVTITGGNMSGKSTFIKQVALLQIMAQMGCLVPAVEAQFALCRRICTRIGSDDDFESNASTFYVEMREASYILDDLDEDSLVLIDELGRGTSTTEGLALTTAICEELLRSRATILFVTHFEKLVSYLGTFSNVTRLTLCAPALAGEEDALLGQEEKILAGRRDRVLTAGEVRPVQSGIDLAARMDLPPGLVEGARAMCRVLDEEINDSRHVDRSVFRVVQKEKLIIKARVHCRL